MTVPTDYVNAEGGGLPDVRDGFITDSGSEKEPMSKNEVQYAVSAMLDDAITYQQSDLSPWRGYATDYYMGRPFGDEEEGRSQVVTTEVRDSVQAIMPSLMRIFFGPENVAEFRARNAEDSATAKQQTEYVNYVISEDNPGFLILYAAFKDALVRRLGIVKWFWEDNEDTTAYTLSGVSDDQLTALATDETVEQLRAIGQTQGPQGQTLYDVEVVRKVSDGVVRIATVPPEEYIFSRAARSQKESLLVGHRQMLRRSELLSMGIPPEIVDEHGGPDTSLEQTDEAIKRQPHSSTADLAESPDEATDKVSYTESYCYMDVDGDGIAEHRRICTIGSSYYVVWNDPWPERPFATFCMDPEPHTMWGLSIADRTMDLQNIKSHVLRGMLDSLSFSLHPRMAAVEGQVNISDVQNTEIGAIIRERQPGMVRDFTHEFVGGQAFPMLEYIDQVKEERTGISKASAGLSPDALQSSTKAAVDATVSARSQNLELIARLFAETGMKDLLKGVLRLTVQHQDRPRTIRLNNEYVDVDPRPWTADMDVSTNVALGSGVTEDKVQQLTVVAQKQQEILQEYGPNNPLVGLGQYRNTLGKILELLGYKDTTKFFKPLPEDFQMPPPPPPPPPPEQVMAQVEMAKTQAKTQDEDQDRQLKHKEIMLREERERKRNQVDAFLKATELEMKYGVKIDENRIRLYLGELNAEVALTTSQDDR